jgi:UDP-GlcNAc:undecaprenyl-phosphate GlcNAc-1-phosphate transferase
MPPPSYTLNHTLTADDVLSPYIYVFYAAFIVSFIFTPVMRSIAMYYGIVDRPDRIRKLHKEPVAYLGGLAVFLGWLAGLAMSQFLYTHRSGPGLPDHVIVRFSIVASACMIVALGMVDDLRSLPPKMKILGQIAAAQVLLSAGVGTKVSYHFLDPIVIRIVATCPSLSWLLEPHFYANLALVISILITTCVVVFCCNATNLMDGLDGLCGGVTAIIASGLLFLAVYLGMTGAGSNTNWDALRVVLGLALLGGVLGFVPYNFNPASIFMGDTGSMFLGFSCATLIVLMGDREGRWFLAAGVMFSLPILDTTLAFARRYVNGRPLFSADKFHFHHQLVARGFSVRGAVLTSYGLATFFTIAGAAVVVLRERYVVGFYLVLFGYIMVAAVKIGMVHEKTVVVQRRPLGADRSNQSNKSATIEPNAVVEVHLTDESPAGPTASVPGGWAADHGTPQADGRAGTPRNNNAAGVPNPSVDGSSTVPGKSADRE